MKRRNNVTGFFIIVCWNGIAVDIELIGLGVYNTRNSEMFIRTCGVDGQGLLRYLITWGIFYC